MRLITLDEIIGFLKDNVRKQSLPDFSQAIFVLFCLESD